MDLGLDGKFISNFKPAKFMHVRTGAHKRFSFNIWGPKLRRIYRSALMTLSLALIAILPVELAGFHHAT